MFAAAGESFEELVLIVLSICFDFKEIFSSLLFVLPLFSKNPTPFVISHLQFFPVHLHSLCFLSLSFKKGGGQAMCCFKYNVSSPLNIMSVAKIRTKKISPISIFEFKNPTA